MNTETVSPEQKEFIAQHENDDVRQLALSFSTREDLSFLLSQIKGRQTAKQKIPTWHANDDVIYPIHLSMEQSSSEKTARYKATLFPSRKEKLVDLSGGLGVDFYFLSPYFRQAVYVEQNAELCEIARHNFNVLGLKNATVIHAQSEEYIHRIEKANIVYADPARRSDTGQKVFRIEDCNPNMAELKTELLNVADWVMIKYSPMLDISQAIKTLGKVREVHIVSVDNECKELIFLLSPQAFDCHFCTVNIKKNGVEEMFAFHPDEERAFAPLLASRVEKYLYEPNASIMKAGGFNTVAKVYSVEKLHPNSHLYTSDKFIPDFPGRIFIVQEVFQPNKRNIRNKLSIVNYANIAVRNFPMSVDEIRKKTRLKEGGEVYLFATTLCNEEKVWIVCGKY